MVRFGSVWFWSPGRSGSGRSVSRRSGVLVGRVPVGPVPVGARGDSTVCHGSPLFSIVLPKNRQTVQTHIFKKIVCHKPSSACSYDFLVLFIELRLKSCIGYIGHPLQNREFRKFEKIAPSKIKNLVEFLMFLNETVIRPASKRP